jgi:hypothetical protein
LLAQLANVARKVTPTEVFKEETFSMKLFFALTAFALLAAPTVFAADTGAQANSSTASSGLKSILKNISGNQTAWLSGSTSEALDGKEGKGPDLTVLHTTAIGYKIDKKLSAGFGININQYIRTKETAAAAGDWRNRKFEMTTPYLQVAHNSLYKNGNFSLSGYARYYVPIFNAARNSVGGVADAGNGAIRPVIVPAYTFLDGRLTLSALTYFQYRFAKNAPANHQNYFFLIDPVIAYAITPKVEVYTEYATGRIRHNKLGKWTTLNKPDGQSQQIAVGVNYVPTPKWVFNTNIYWQSVNEDGRVRANYILNKYSIDAIASYTFM